MSDPSIPGFASLPVQKITAGHSMETDDPVAIEEPLEISLQYGPAASSHKQSISVTMRTPGHDAELAAGFLFTEGILPDASSIRSTRQNTASAILVSLLETISPDLGRLQRHFYTSSSCGVCGKSSIDALRTLCPKPAAEEGPFLDATVLQTLPYLLRQRQDIFNKTGGLHAAALFDPHGELIVLREDIGRHNAVDKVIGYSLSQNKLPLNNAILLLSGRACFELIQKAAMAGVRIVAAVGPPSSLAVQLAEEYGITLAGFLREQRFNIYSGARRIRI